MLPPTEKQRRAYDLHMAGKSYREIGIEIGVSAARVQQLIEKYKWLLKYEDGTKQLMRSSGEEALSCPIIYLPIGTRSYHGLKNADIRTIGELVQKSELELLKIRNFGNNSLVEIKKALKNLGLQLSGFPKAPKRTKRKRKVICPRCEYHFEV